MTMDNSYNFIRIQQYLKGELSPEEMNQLEKEALDDPFLNDALEGYQQKGINTGKLTLMQQRLQDRIAEQPQERSRMLLTSQRLSVAAVACLLFILACVLLWMVSTRPTNQNDKKQIALELSTSEPIPSGNGLSIARKLTAQSGSPQKGWEEFNAYIKQSMRPLKEKGVVVLTFDVDEQGRPLHIKATKGKDPFVKEAIRLLQNGPLWEENNPVTVEFVFE